MNAIQIVNKGPGEKSNPFSILQPFSLQQPLIHPVGGVLNGNPFIQIPRKNQHFPCVGEEHEEGKKKKEPPIGH